MDKKQFEKIIQLASRPVAKSGQRLKKKSSGGYSGKRTHQHSAEDTSEKQRDKSRQ